MNAVIKSAAARQAAFAERQRAAGRKRVHFWVTPDEARLVQETLARLQVGQAIETETGVCLDFGAPHCSPSALTDTACEIREITPLLASRLVRTWHSLLPHIPPSNIQRNKHAVCFALVVGGWAHAVAIYTSPVSRHLSDGVTLELRRLAIAPTCPKNTATWFMARCEKRIRAMWPEIARLVSYQDTSAHTGTIYKAGNWCVGAETPYRPWVTGKRARAPSQTKSKKIRWEKRIS